MNSTELYIAASEAIGEWLKEHNQACVLTLENEKVVCKKALEPTRLDFNPLYVSIREVTQGMSQARWSLIGSALHNLYCKELACQARQKH